MFAIILASEEKCSQFLNSMLLKWLNKYIKNLSFISLFFHALNYSYSFSIRTDNNNKLNICVGSHFFIILHTKKSPVKTTGIPVRPYLTLFSGYFKQIF